MKQEDAQVPAADGAPVEQGVGRLVNKGMVMTRVPPMKCKKHLIPECPACKKAVAPKDKPHGPVSEHLMRHWYGAKR